MRSNFFYLQLDEQEYSISIFQKFPKVVKQHEKQLIVHCKQINSLNSLFIEKELTK